MRVPVTMQVPEAIPRIVTRQSVRGRVMRVEAGWIFPKLKRFGKTISCAVPY